MHLPSMDRQDVFCVPCIRRKETARTLFLSSPMAIRDMRKIWIWHSLYAGPASLLLSSSIVVVGEVKVIFSFEGSFEDTKAVLDFVLNDTQYGFDKTTFSLSVTV